MTSTKHQPELLHRFFQNFFAGCKQLKPACIPPAGSYPTPPHPSPTSFSVMNGVRDGGTHLPKEMPPGLLFQQDRGTETETCTVLTAFQVATAFHSLSTHRRTGEDGVSVAIRLCQSPGDQSKQGRRCLQHLSLLTEETHTGHRRKRERNNCTSEPTISLPI